MNYEWVSRDSAVASVQISSRAESLPRLLDLMIFITRIFHRFYDANSLLCARVLSPCGKDLFWVLGTAQCSKSVNCDIWFPLVTVFWRWMTVTNFHQIQRLILNGELLWSGPFIRTEDYGRWKKNRCCLSPAFYRDTLLAIGKVMGLVILNIQIQNLQ